MNAAGFYGAEVAALAGQADPRDHPGASIPGHRKHPGPGGRPDPLPLVRDPDICFYLRRERASFLFGSYGHPGRPAFADGIPEDFAHQLFPDSLTTSRRCWRAPWLTCPCWERRVSQRWSMAPSPIPRCPAALRPGLRSCRTSTMPAASRWASPSRPRSARPSPNGSPRARPNGTWRPGTRGASAPGRQRPTGPRGWWSSMACSTRSLSAPHPRRSAGRSKGTPLYDT